MFRFIGRASVFLWTVVLTSTLAGAALAQSPTGALHGLVTDPSGSAVPGATVIVAGSRDVTRTAITDRGGEFTIKGLPPGKYTVTAVAPGFAGFEKDNVEVAAGPAQKLDISLTLAEQKQQVVVEEHPAALDVNPANNAGALVLNSKDLEVFSDDPDELQSELQALAGPAAGPNGGQIYIDGFTGGQIPPKSAIREVRINQNPFSAEYDKLGYGRIEILTKPGTDKFHGQVHFNLDDAIFDARNPFALTRPSFDSRIFDGDLSGALGRKASFFLDAQRRDQQESSVVSAEVLDPNFNPIPFSQVVPNPRTRTNITPRLDYQLGKNNTLTMRYEFERETQQGAGVGQFSLVSQAYNFTNQDQTLQVSDTQVVSPAIINETRFQYERLRDNQTSVNSQPSIDVLGAFTGGGNSLGLVADNEDHYEVQNYTSISHGKHFIKFGGRLRAAKIASDATSNFNGTFTFPSLTAFQITQQGLAMGLTGMQIRALGGGASQFSITAGSPLASVSQFDVGLFGQDDWRFRPNMTLSLGLRFESQNNISDHADIAPRLGFAWGLDGGKSGAPKTVLRFGFGMFYDRFDQGLVLQAQRLNGITQQQFIVPLPDFFPNVPPISTLGGPSMQTIRRIDANLRAPYLIQSALSLERQLPKRITMSLNYINSHGVHQLLSRNVNAFLPGTFNPLDPNSGVRPFPSQGNIYSYESDGIFNQNQFIANINARPNSNITVFGYYLLNYARSNTDGANSFPANQYDLNTQYGRAAFDVRHRLFIGGHFGLPYGFGLSPFIVANSGAPFDITVGQDLNGDSIFNDRPAFATDLTRPSVVITRFGAFDTMPIPGQTIIPRNYGTGPALFTVNLRATKNFGFGPKLASSAGGQAGPAPGSFGRFGGRGGGGGGMGGHRGAPGEGSDRRYTLTLSVQARNLLNRVNLAPPIGDLSSPLFGRSNALAGGPFSSPTANRRMEFQIRFTF